jgi:hypothetical protein
VDAKLFDFLALANDSTSERKLINCPGGKLERFRPINQP